MNIRAEAGALDGKAGEIFYHPAVDSL